MKKHHAIIAVETANPVLTLSQQEAWESVQKKSGLSSKTLRWYEKFLLAQGIETRHFAFDEPSRVFDETADQAIARFQNAAALLGTETLNKTLRAAQLAPGSLDTLITTTCTGYLCPGLTSYVSQAAGLRADIQGLDLAGIGCGAALPALRSADQFLKTHPESTVAVLCVEICSAAIHWGDEIDLILSNSIFADGAACVILTNRSGYSGPSLMNFESLLWAQYRDELRFKHRDARLCNVISPRVPDLVSEAVQSLHEKLSQRLTRTADHIGVHPGGRKILDMMEHRIPDFKGMLESSREVLRRFGNMSSPSVLFVLKEMIQSGKVESGDQILLYAFGAGFTAFGVHLNYEPIVLPSGQGDRKESYAYSVR